MRRFIEWSLSSLMLLAAVVFVACSDDDKEAVEPLAPIFENPFEIRGVVGVIETMEFSSEVEWSVSSNAVWCTLSIDGKNFAYDVVSGAGDALLYVKIGDDAHQFSESCATLTMVRRGNKETIATVCRTPKDYELRVLDADGEECQSIAVSSDGELQFSVEANFDFGVSEKLVWIDDFTVKSEEQNSFRRTFSISVNDKYVPFPCKDVITFFNSDSTALFPYDVTYSGMDAKVIRIDGENPWGWNLSADGSVFSAVNSISGNALSYDGAVTYNVTALNYDCRYICFSEAEDSLLQLMEPKDSWLKVTVDYEDASKVSISGEPYPAETEGERKGYVVALPAATYDSIMSIYSSVQKISFIDSVYNNVMIEVTQVSDYIDLSAGFTVMQGMVNELDCFEESDPAFLSLLKEKYSLDKVYSVSADAGAYLQVFTHLSERVWEAWNQECTFAIDSEGNEINLKELSFEVAMDAEENYYLSVKALATPVIIVLRGINGEYLKALVIKSGITLDPGTGFDVKYMMIQDVPCALETDMELAAYIIERFGTKEIYAVTERVGRTLQIFPHLTEEQWIGWLESSVKAIDFDGNEIKLSELSYEVAMNDNDEFYSSTKIKKNPYVLLFLSPEGEAIKAIVIRPKS